MDCLILRLRHAAFVPAPFRLPSCSTLDRRGLDKFRLILTFKLTIRDASVDLVAAFHHRRDRCSCRERRELRVRACPIGDRQGTGACHHVIGISPAASGHNRRIPLLGFAPALARITSMIRRISAIAWGRVVPRAMDSSFCRITSERVKVHGVWPRLGPCG